MHLHRSHVFRNIALTLALLIAFLAVPRLGVMAQETEPQAPAEQPAAKKPARRVPAAKPMPKAGEVMPLEQGAAEPAQPQAPAEPVAADSGPAAKAQPAAAKTKGKAEKTQVTVPVRAKTRGGQITLGALLPLSGSMSPQGESAKAALEMAVEDLNAYFNSVGSNERVGLQVEDTQGVPAKALDRLKALHSGGVQMVVGPLNDDEIDAVLDFSDKNGMILLSPASAGPYLSKRVTGNLLRLAPSDAFQAEALAVLANQEGATEIIPIWVGDMYGDELVTHIKGQFANLGGQVIPGTRFRPNETQFAKYVADLKAQIDKNVKDKKHLAIVVVARGAQTASILQEAAKIGGLGDAKWYGGDDSALRGAVIQDPEVAKFAARVRIAFARYGETGTKTYSDLEKRLEQKISAFVDTQSLAAYDAAWLCALAAASGPTDVASLKKALIDTAEHTYGSTGWLAFNDKADRREDYDFDFWTIKQVDGKFYWEKTARYQYDPGNGKQLIINRPEEAEK